MAPKNTQSLILNILLLILTTHSLISRLIILNLKLKFKLIYQITHVYGPWAMRYKIGLNSTQLVAPSNLNPPCSPITTNSPNRAMVDGKLFDVLI